MIEQREYPIKEKEKKHIQIFTGGFVAYSIAIDKEYQFFKNAQNKARTINFLPL